MKGRSRRCSQFKLLHKNIIKTSKKGLSSGITQHFIMSQYVSVKNEKYFQVVFYVLIELLAIATPSFTN